MRATVTVELARKRPGVGLTLRAGLAQNTLSGFGHGDLSTARRTAFPAKKEATTRAARQHSKTAASTTRCPYTPLQTRAELTRWNGCSSGGLVEFALKIRNRQLGVEREKAHALGRAAR